MVTEFDEEYKASKLRNWEVPKWFPERPRRRFGHTDIISNDRGHLLPGVPRSVDQPWGDFVNTWHLPKKISRDLANKLGNPNKTRQHNWQRSLEKQPSSPNRDLLRSGKQETKDKLPDIAPAEKQPSVESLSLRKLKEGQTDEECICEPECICEEGTGSRKLQSKHSSALSIEGPPERTAKYIPGDLTDPDKVHPSHYQLQAERLIQPEIRTSEHGYPSTIEDLAKIEEPVEPDNAYKVEEMYRKHKEMLLDNQCNGKVECPHDEEYLKPLFNASYNFDFARKLHKENLEHEPLPDTVTHRMYRHMQMQRAAQEAGLAIEEGDVDSRNAIGYKGYTGHGPHKCTKMKVYRPKTVAKPGGFIPKPKEDSVCSFDKKWRFIRQEKVSPIELALCWDLTPVNVSDEPKPPVHIDGSNGSQAPAVFAMVHTPKDAVDDMLSNTKRCDGIRGCATESNASVPEDQRPKTSWHKRQNITSEMLHRSNSAKAEPKQSLHCCSKRLCVACELKNMNLTSAQPKVEYKQAFKAGNPNSRSSTSSNASGNKELKIPKPRDPYVKKSYNIESLRPPFCLRKGKREEYPDHWRLASVYQHSYKPLSHRKKPLLASIYK